MSNLCETDPIAEFIQALPSRLGLAAIGCALPHWFDRTTGVKLITKLIEDSAAAERVFAELLRLPFIYRHSDHTWQYTEVARSYCYERLRTRDHQYHQLSQLMSQLLLEIREQLAPHADAPMIEHDDKSWTLRQVQWQLAYHLAPIDSDASMRELINISKWAGSSGEHLADHQLVLTVWREQKTLLEQYKVEGAFLEGRHAYACQDWPEAEQKFAFVWREGAHNPLVTAIAGHLLGVILRHKGQPQMVEQAEEVLRGTLWRCEQLDQNQPETRALTARVLNSLGATLIQLDRFDEAQEILERSLQLQEELDDILGKVRVLNTITTLILEQGGGDPDNVERAERILRETLTLNAGTGDVSARSALQSTLARALIQRGDERALREAEQLLKDSLRVARTRNDVYHEALVLARLGECLSVRDDHRQRQRALEHFRQSLALWKRLGHLRGQVMVLRQIGDVYELLEQFDKARQARLSAGELEF